jgi:hypothetical protein
MKLRPRVAVEFCRGEGTFATSVSVVCHVEDGSEHRGALEFAAAQRADAATVDSGALDHPARHREQTVRCSRAPFRLMPRDATTLGRSRTTPPRSEASAKQGRDRYGSHRRR